MKSIGIVTIGLVLLLLWSCAPATPTAPPQPPVGTTVPAKAQKQAWEGQWEKTLASAKQEGNLVVATTSGGEIRIAITGGFKDKHGIGIEWVVGKGAELAEKIAGERRAGLYLLDAYLAGATTMTNTLKPAGFLEPLKPMLILPEVTDPKVWWDGKLPFIDEETNVSAVCVYVQSLVFINTQLVKPDDLKSYNDLLNPKWKGKITMQDPTIPGASLAWMQMIGLRTMGVDYLRQLAAQDIQILRDERLLSEWLAKGKNPILIGVKPDPIAEFEKAGAPVKEAVTSEGGFLSTGPGNVAIMNKAPHPNAAIIFLNWLLSKDGQLIYSKANLTQAARNDISTDHLDPFRLRVPGKKYLLRDTEEIMKKEKDDIKVISEIFAKSLAK